MSLIKKLRELCIIATEGGQGKCLRIAFCSKEKTQKACGKIKDAIVNKRQKQTAKARKSQGQPEVLNNRRCSTGEGVEHHNSIIYNKEDIEIEGIELNNTDNIKNKEGRRRKTGGATAISRRKISAAKAVFEDMFNSGKKAQDIVNEKGLSQISDTDEIEKVVVEVIAGNEKAVSDFNAGKQQSLAFLVGQVMKATKGRANPAVAKETLLDKLGGNKGA